jgi:flavin-dependent dehydrogenase
MKSARVTLAVEGAEPALRRFLRAHFDDGPENTSSPYDNMIDILASGEPDWLSHYVVVNEAGEIVGFFAYEEIDAMSVGVYASVVSRAVTGLSERLVVEFMEEVAERYPLVNLGGSETDGLDRYKQKYADRQGRRNPLLAIDMSRCTRA